jgi:hypothetical protein
MQSNSIVEIDIANSHQLCRVATVKGLYELAEAKMDEIVLDAAVEQGLVNITC